MVKNQIFEMEIDSFSSTGDGVGRIDGQVVFVKGAIAGERCKVKILKVGKNIAYGKIENIITPSVHRVKPSCENFGKCGGCSLMHMDYDMELDFKRQRVQDALVRIGGMELDDLPITASPKTYNYRNKCIYAVGKDKKGRPCAGFFRQRSHDVIPSESCNIQAQVANRAAVAVCRWMDMCKVEPYDEEKRSGIVRHIFCRYGFVSGQAQVAIVSAKDKIPQAPKLVELLTNACPEVTSIVLNVNKTTGNTVFGGTFRTLWGEDGITDTLCGLTFKLSARSFYQVNHDQAENLYSYALSLADLHGEETVLDLYCGTGTITLCLASKAKNVIGAEIVPEAIVDANENAERNGIKNARFICADAFRAAAQLDEEGIKTDVIVVDPPRKGLAPEVIDIICSMAPQRVVYVSCDPATLARDVKLFSEKGYAASHARAFDMFPRTSHVETVCLLTKADKHDMQLAPEPFAMIASGQKTIELRLYDEKRKKLKVGDTIEFTNTDSGEKLLTIVKKLHLSPSFHDLYQSLPLLQCGYTEGNVKQAAPADMNAYYSEEQQQRYGVVGIELFPPKQITDETVCLLSTKDK